VNELVKNNDNGLLFPARNPVELASSIKILLDDRNLRKKLSDGARNTVKDKHSWGSVLARLDSVYESARAN
jgi:glycosyltransferase involved in cell wall biosynthesis